MQLTNFKSALTSSSLEVYAGYSAGAVVAGPTLKGIELVDPIDEWPDDYPNKEVLWEGLGLIDFVIAPHYKSDHPESSKIDDVVDYLEKNNIPFRPLRDGEVYNA